MEYMTTCAKVARKNATETIGTCCPVHRRLDTMYIEKLGHGLATACSKREKPRTVKAEIPQKTNKVRTLLA